MKKIRLAILGQGRSGRDIHASNLVKMGDIYEIAVIVDPMEDRRERARKEFGCETLTDYRELSGAYRRLDLVVNATPSHFHVPVSLDLMRRGLNVLCEKPLARTAAEVDGLIRASKENNVLLAVFQQSRFSPLFVEMKRIIDSGVLGRIIQISMQTNGFARWWDWQTVQENNAGSLYNTGPHSVDQALRLLDYDGMPDVKCYMGCVNTFGDAEDYVKLLITAPGKPVIDLEISCCNAYPAYSVNIHAQYGGLKVDGDRIDYKYYSPAEAPEQKLTLTPIMKDDGTPAYCVEDLVMHEESWSLPPEHPELFESNTISFYKMLYNVLVNGGTLEITPEQVRQQIAVMEEAHRQNPLPVLVRS